MRTELAAGLALVLALHAAALYGLMKYRLIPLPDKVETLFVTFIPPPEPLQPEPPRPKPHEAPKPVRLEQPRLSEPHPHLVVEAPAAPTDYAMPLPPQPPSPAIEVPPPPLKPVGPVNLSGELALACPARTPPKYPVLSQRVGESGQVVLRVELDSNGRVDAAHIATSSGYKRLDEAGLNAVKTWRCNPPLRDGQPVRAVALQPFKFNLE